MARVTIDQLAKSLGLTKSTVSRALNDYPDISAKTKKKVSEQALAMGYRPSQQARGLKTGISKSVGLVLNMDAEHTHKPFLSDFIDGLSATLSTAGWTLTVATARNQNETLSVHRNLLIERKVDGFILPRTATRDSRVEMLREADVPFVLFGRTADQTGCAWYDIDGELAMFHAVRRLVAFGHQRIAYIGGAPDSHFHLLRQQGFTQALEQFGLPQEKVLLRSGGMTEAGGANAAQALLHLPSPPTALVCALDRGALGSYRSIRDLGLKVGQEVSVIGYDGIPEGAYATPALTSFAVDNAAAGSKLAELLLRRIDGEPLDKLREIGKARLVERASDGPPLLSSEQLAVRIGSR